MIKFLEDDNIDLIIKDDYIIILAPNKEEDTLKKLFNIKRGIFCKNGYGIDTINGKLFKLKEKANFSYNPFDFGIKKRLSGKIDYEVFHKFIEYKEYFQKYFKIVLYWDNSSATTTYKKTSTMDMGCGATRETLGKAIKQIAVNEKSVLSIRLEPTLEKTLDSFVDEYTIGDWYKKITGESE